MGKAKKWNNFVLVCMSINRGLPLDKVFIILYIISSYFQGFRLTNNNKIVLFILYFFAVFSFILNTPDSNFQIFYPPLFLTGALFLAGSDMDLITLRKIILFNILFGIFAVIFASAGFDNNYVFSLREKNLPDIYGPYGFSPTQQVYGTFCILYIVISFELKKCGFFFFCSLLALFMTLNRASLLFLGIILFIYRPKIFTLLMICVGILIISYWSEIQLILFSTSTLDSREELRRGVEISFWNSNDIFIYLFGKAETNVTDIIAQKTIWERTYIEHGLDFIVHSYGFIGLIIYIILCICFFAYLFLHKQAKLVLFCFYYLLIQPNFTHEFLASSFFFFMATILLISKKASDANEKLKKTMVFRNNKQF